MRAFVALVGFLAVVSSAFAATREDQTGTPDSRAAKAAAREWLRRNPEFGAKTGNGGNGPCNTKVDHNNAEVLVRSWPPGPLQGVIRLKRVNGAWRVVSAKTRPRPRDLLAVRFEFVFDASGKARHITLIRCVDLKSHK